MTSKAPTFSMVMPCYNEQETLPRTIPPLLDAFERSGIDFELVLVDNGSVDRTGEIIDGFTDAHPVRKAVVEHNQGYGFGILTGLDAARGDFVGYMCPDGQIWPEDAVAIVREMDHAGNGHLVKVRRTLRGDGLLRSIVSRVYNLLFLVLFGSITADANGTPKILHRSDLERVDPRSKDWFIDAEIMIEAHRRGLRVLEIEVPFLPREQGASHVRASTAWEFLRNMVRHRLGRRP